MKFFKSRKRGMTLVEILIATSLMGAISASLMGTVLFIAKSDYRSHSYTEMEQQARGAIEGFARDVRMARTVNLVSNNQIKLTVPISTDSTLADGYKDYVVYYTYFPATATTASLRNTFCRRVESSEDTTQVAASNAETSLLSGVQNFTFKRYQLSSPIRAPDTSLPETVLPEAANDLETKQLLISLNLRRSRMTLSDSTNVVVSARYILRNKVVTN